MNSIANAPYNLDFFSNVACDPVGNGEGATFLGSLIVTTDAAGDATFNGGFPFAAGSGFITATATDAAGNTSEFSACRASTTGGGDLALSISDSPDPVGQGQNVTYTYSIVNNGPSPATNVTLVGSFGPGLTFVSATSGCVFGTPCNLGTIAPGSPVAVVVTMRADAAGTTSASASVSSDVADPNVSNNSDTQLTSVTGVGAQTFIVTNTNDSGAGSLRQAILDANANAGADTISFNIAGTGVHTIVPTSPPPTIAETVTINGASQPFYPGTPVIEIDGTSAGPNANGLVVSGPASAGTQIIGLTINRFGTGGSGSGGDGIVIQSAPEVAISQSVIGLDAGGTIARGNRTDGVFVDGTTADTNNFTIAGSVVSGNGRNGILILGTGVALTVAGNRIGTDATGRFALGNGRDGLSVAGGPRGGITGGIAGNIISGNRRYGISIAGNDGLTTIYSNIIGPDAAGTGAIGNGAGGILVGTSTNTEIGTPGAANAIAFSDGNGVSINSGGGNLVNANAIFSNAGLPIDLAPAGTTATNVLDFEDRPDSIAIPSPFPSIYQGITWTNWYEGAPVESRGYQPDGVNSIWAAVSGATFTFPPRAFLGARFSRSTQVPSPGAVFFELYRQGSLVATSPALPDDAAPLTFLPSGYVNQVDEVRVISLGNSMTPGGAAWVIDDLVFADGPTPNDADDSDSGANGLQNFPVITTATNVGGTLEIQATLVSTPNAGFQIEFFSTPSCGPTGPQQSLTYLGTTFLAGDGSGTMTIDASFGAVPAGHFITAIATAPNLSTSEFSPCVIVSAGTAAIDLAPATLTLLTRDAGTLTASFNVPVGASGTTIVTANDNPAAATVETNLAVSAGASLAAIGVTTGTTAGTAHVSASSPEYGSGAAAQVVVSARALALAPASSFVGVGKTIGGTLTLANPAPIGGATIALTSLNPGFVTIAPASVSIPAGGTSASFTLTGVAEGAAILNASAPGFITAITSVTGSANQGFTQTTISFFNPAPIPAPNGAVDRLVGSVVSYFNPAPIPATTGASDRFVGTAVSYFNPAPAPAPGGSTSRLAEASISYLNPAPNAASAGGMDGLAQEVVSFANGPSILSVSPPQLSRAVNGAQTLTIHGANLTGTGAVAASPSTGISIGTPSVSSDGATVTVPVTLTTATPTSFVNITLSGSYGSTPQTSASSFEVVP